MSYCDGDRLVCLVGEGDLGRVVGLEFRFVGVFLSATAIAQAEATVVDEIVSGSLSVREVAAEDLVFAASRGELYDIVFAVCVGALDGRYPEVGQLRRRRQSAS